MIQVPRIHHQRTRIQRLNERANRLTVLLHHSKLLSMRLITPHRSPLNLSIRHQHRTRRLALRRAHSTRALQIRIKYISRDLLILPTRSIRLLPLRTTSRRQIIHNSRRLQLRLTIEQPKTSIIRRQSTHYSVRRPLSIIRMTRLPSQVRIYIQLIRRRRTVIFPYSTRRPRRHRRLRLTLKRLHRTRYTTIFITLLSNSSRFLSRITSMNTLNVTGRTINTTCRVTRLSRLNITKRMRMRLLLLLHPASRISLLHDLLFSKHPNRLPRLIRRLTRRVTPHMPRTQITLIRLILIRTTAPALLTRLIQLLRSRRYKLGNLGIRIHRCLLGSQIVKRRTKRRRRLAITTATMRRPTRTIVTNLLRTYLTPPPRFLRNTSINVNNQRVIRRLLKGCLINNSLLPLIRTTLVLLRRHLSTLVPPQMMNRSIQKRRFPILRRVPLELKPTIRPRGKSLLFNNIHLRLSHISASFMLRHMIRHNVTIRIRITRSNSRHFSRIKLTRPILTSRHITTSSL